MEISSLFANEVNQNGYHLNKLTKNKIGILYIAPVNMIPEDCLACDGYVLKIVDYKKLYSAIGTKFNTGNETSDEFRIPDYNITGRFLQPGANVGNLIAAGLPAMTHTHTATTSSNGAHTHTRGSMEIIGSFNGDDYSVYPSGAFYEDAAAARGSHTETVSGNSRLITFKASRNWTGATSSNGAHTHTLTTANNSSVNALYGKSTTVQPPSQIVHICIKYK